MKNLKHILRDLSVKSGIWYFKELALKKGYSLDVLINDEDPFVRAAVAKQGYGLDILVNDKHWVVRKAVVEQGYGLDKLINDEDPIVRAVALMIKNNG